MNKNQEASTATPVVDTNENQKSGGVLVFNFGKFENQKLSAAEDLPQTLRERIWRDSWKIAIAPCIFAIPVLALATREDFGDLGPIPNVTAGYLIFATTYLTNLAFGIDRLSFQNPLRPRSEIALELIPGAICLLAPYLTMFNSGFEDKLTNRIAIILNTLSLFRSAAIYGQVMPPNMVRLYYNFNLVQRIDQFLRRNLSRLLSYQEFDDNLYDLKKDLIGNERQLQKQLRLLLTELNYHKQHNLTKTSTGDRLRELETLLSTLNDLKETTQDTSPANAYQDQLQLTINVLDKSNIKSYEDLIMIVYNYTYHKSQLQDPLEHSLTSWIMSYIPTAITALCIPSILFVTVTEALESETLSEEAKELLFFCIALPVGMMGIDTLNQFYHTANQQLLSIHPEILHSLYINFIGKPLLTLGLCAGLTTLLTYTTNQAMINNIMITAGSAFLSGLLLNLFQEPSRITRPVFWLKVATLVLVLGSWGGLAAVYNDVFDSSADLKWSSFWDYLSNIVPYLSNETGINGLSQIILYLGVCIFNSYGAIFGLWKQIDGYEAKASKDPTVVTVDPESQISNSVELNLIIEECKKHVELAKNREETVRYDGKELYRYGELINPETTLISSIFEKLPQTCNGKKARYSDDGLREGLLPDRIPSGN